MKTSKLEGIDLKCTFTNNKESSVTFPLSLMLGLFSFVCILEAEPYKWVDVIDIVQHMSAFQHLRQCLCLCLCDQGGWRRWEWKRQKAPHLIKKGWVSLKAHGCIFTSQINHLCSLFSASLPFFISFHPFIIPHIPRHFAASPSSTLFHQREPEMNPLSCIIYPQSKSLKRASAIVYVSIERKCLCVNLTLPDCRLLMSDHWPGCTQRAKKPMRNQLTWDDFHWYKVKKTKYS